MFWLPLCFVLVSLFFFFVLFMTPPTTQRRAESKSVSSPTASARFWTRLLIWHVFLNVSPEVGPAFTQKAFLLSQKKKVNPRPVANVAVWNCFWREKCLCSFDFFCMWKTGKDHCTSFPKREHAWEKNPKISYKKIPKTFGP